MSQRLLGIILLVAGILLLAFGINASDSVADTLSEGFTGKFTDSTMWYLIGGAALAVAGAALAFSGGRKVRA